ncbi:MAG: methyl-accepting chemotaxis protein [Janthinobacterium lividum]
MAIGSIGLFASSGLRILDIVARKRAAADSVSQARALRSITLLAGLSALSWSVLITALGRGQTPNDLIFVISLHIALISAGATSLSAIPAASLSFVLLLGLDACFNIAAGIWPLMPEAQMLLLMFLAMLARAVIGQAHVFAERGMSEVNQEEMELARHDERAQIAVREAKLQAEAETRASGARQVHERELRQRHHSELLELAERFESTVFAASGRVLEAADGLRSSSGHLATLGPSIEAQTDGVDAAASSARLAADRVAATTSDVHGMALSISVQIAAQADASCNARHASEQSNQTVQALAAQVDGVEQITSLIGSIASRTNLLALNATIEAARAGEAGRGFSVVACEVKALAAQTRDATGEIEKRLAGMQIHVEHAVCSIADTVRQIGSLADAASAIQTAVAQQQRATEEIHADAGEASISTASLHERFSAVAGATREAGLLSESIGQTANLVACDTASLRDAATQFIERLRKA